MPDRPYGTPEVLPVDERYEIKPAARAAVRRRMRQHLFHLVAPDVSGVATGVYDRVDHRGLHELRFEPRRSLRIRAGGAIELPLPPDDFGWVAARVDGSGPTRVVVAGEPLSTSSAGARRVLAAPLHGAPILVAGADDAHVRSVTLFARRASCGAASSAAELSASSRALPSLPPRRRRRA